MFAASFFAFVYMHPVNKFITKHVNSKKLTKAERPLHGSLVKCQNDYIPIHCNTKTLSNHTNFMADK